MRRVAQATRELGAIAGAVAEAEQPPTPETTQRIANLVDRALDTLTHLKNDLRETARDTSAAQAAE